MYVFSFHSIHNAIYVIVRTLACLLGQMNEQTNGQTVERMDSNATGWWFFLEIGKGGITPKSCFSFAFSLGFSDIVIQWVVCESHFWLEYHCLDVHCVLACIPHTQCTLYMYMYMCNYYTL